ncbi:MAG: protein of unknown function (DUF303) [Verrucomicrobia bacterium]|nr:MAG: protein of unknown function (DUF303) [Verrucomicrobiota bacterium]
MPPKTAFLSAFLVCLQPSFLRAADLAIQSPKNYQVFQRADRNSATIRVQGRASEIGAVWQYRFEGKSAEGELLPETWRDFPAPLQKDRFDFLTTTPAGGWYKFEVRGLKAGTAIALATVEHVAVGEVFIVAGQSNAGNYGSEPQRSQSGLVANFDGKSWEPANDPQRGAGGKGGSFLPAFGDAIAAQFHVPIGLVPIASGGTSVREWLPEGEKFAQQTTTGKGVRAAAEGGWESNGTLYNTLASRLSELGVLGARAVLWHQGESDAGQARSGYPADRQISGEQYTAFLEKLVAASRKDAGWALPWFSAQTTYHSEQDASDAEFREAQSRAWKNGITLEGPDTDALRAEYRQGVHFNAAGLRKHGELWAQKITPWLENQLTEKKQRRTSLP